MRRGVKKVNINASSCTSHSGSLSSRNVEMFKLETQGTVPLPSSLLISAHAHMRTDWLLLE